jgi:PD-(D/E)XK nuclease superfamily
MLDPDPVTEQDRRAFTLISSHATRGCVLSRSRRNAQGGQLAASALIPRGAHLQALKRARIPQHAFSEVDRLLARPNEAVTSPALVAANLCWRNWRCPTVTAHDGQVRADHPQIARAIGQIQSATSLRLMLRDPLAFVWRYALGWRAVPEDDQPLTLDARTFGELVHELLKRTVDRLEPMPGYARASRQEIEFELTASTETVYVQWPLNRSVPPALLWQHTLAAVSRCTQIPEYARIGCFAALKPRNLPGCWYSKAGITLLQRKGIRSIWQLNPGRTSDGTLSGI